MVSPSRTRTASPSSRPSRTTTASNTSAVLPTRSTRQCTRMASTSDPTSHGASSTTLNGKSLRRHFGTTSHSLFPRADGYGTRFGVTYVDYSTQKRYPKASAKFLIKVCPFTAKGFVPILIHGYSGSVSTKSKPREPKLPQFSPLTQLRRPRVSRSTSSTLQPRPPSAHLPTAHGSAH